MMVSCQKTPTDVTTIDAMPGIFPDYNGVTIPADIAPMNFAMDDDNAEWMDVVVKGSKGGEVHVNGEYVDFDMDEWHELLAANVGGDLTFSVCALISGRWTQYRDFQMHVSQYAIEDFGITYRRIAPGYEVGGFIGIYQRDLHSFDEYAILEESAVPGQCMNCHTANRGSAEQYLIHVRGEKGGTYIAHGDDNAWYTTKTDSTKANFGYSYWHPSGDYIATSVNSIHQSFFVDKEHRIEVYDTMSDALVYDVRTKELLLCPLLQTADWETYPVFSADGKTIYYCTSPPCNMPAEYDKAKYSLCKIAFNPADGTYGQSVDTLLNAIEMDKSFTFPRPSYDGKWLMYNVSDFGNFPVNHKEADLWIMDLATGKTHPLDTVNSDDAEAFHNWSTNSHWFVFSSRRDDGMYNLAYLSSIDAKGNATKPFLLPQRNPRRYYRESLDSFNCPDFTKDKVDFDAHSASRDVLGGNRAEVKVK